MKAFLAIVLAFGALALHAADGRRNNDVMSSDFDYWTFDEDLRKFVTGTKSPVAALRAGASGDLMGKLRWCAVTMYERYDLGLRVEDGAAQCRELANRGSPVGMYLYGWTFGRTMGKTQPQAVAWWRAASEKRFIPGMYAYGRSLAYGDGVAKDERQGRRLLRAASDANFPLAWLVLGSLYMTGTGVEKDVAEGGRLVRLAADAGVPSAMTGMGWIYDQGDGVPQNIPEAVRWYQRAAEQDDLHAYMMLGMMHQVGRGLPKDLDKAAMYYRKILASRDEGLHEIAEKNLKAIGK